MKKLAVIAAVLLLAGSVFSSCRSHERCPAYGQADVDQQEQKA